MARQFFYHARFAADQPVAVDESYQQLVRAVIARHPRIPCKSDQQIIIPGFAGLREFSRAQENLLKIECGGAWRSYFLRSHWRMIFPFSRAHQARTAAALAAALKQNRLPIVHLVKFPALTINHCIVLFGATETGAGWEFESYDPNNAEGTGAAHVRPGVANFFSGAKFLLARRRTERQPHLPLVVFLILRRQLAPGRQTSGPKKTKPQSIDAQDVADFIDAPGIFRRKNFDVLSQNQRLGNAIGISAPCIMP